MINSMERGNELTTLINLNYRIGLFAVIAKISQTDQFDCKSNKNKFKL